MAEKKKGFFENLFGELDKKLEKKSKECKCNKNNDSCCK